jgi:hypothetical protein
MEVDLSIDADGKMIKAEASTGGGLLQTSIGKLAVEAARLWKFQPARLGNRNVPGEVRIQFQFSPYPFSLSEAESDCQLERARAARAEQLSEAGGRLAERGAREIAPIAGEIGGVVQVEHLADQRQTPALAKHECPAHAHIE